jgi:hypothetical protein
VGAQWVLSFPMPLRSVFAVYPELITPVLHIVHRAIHSHLVKQTGVGRNDAHSGAVTLIQRFGGAANLNTHLHALVLHGVYSTAADIPVFIESAAPTLAPNAKLRSKVVRVPPAQTTTGEGDCTHAHSLSLRMTWAWLLKRVFDIDVERCACGRILKRIAVIEEPTVIEKILKHIGLDAQPAPREKARRVELFQDIEAA